MGLQYGHILVSATSKVKGTRASPGATTYDENTAVFGKGCHSEISRSPAKFCKTVEVTDAEDEMDFIQTPPSFVSKSRMSMYPPQPRDYARYECRLTALLMVTGEGRSHRDWS